MSRDDGLPVIELRDATVRFGSFVALDRVSLAVGRRERVVLIGPSGSGKSTLIRCLNGLERPERGAVLAFGRDIGDPTALREARLRTGMIFQQFNLYSMRTAAGNVALAPRRTRGLTRSEARSVALEMLERVGMRDFADQYPFELSGGQQQRVAIARALAMKPDVLLLDEPTSALDPETVREVLSLIEEIASEGRTVICATHEMGFARRLADRLLFLCNGRIVEQGEPADMIARPQSRRLADFLSRTAA